MDSNGSTSKIIIALVILYFLFRQKEPNLESIIEKTGKIISHFRDKDD